MLKLSKEGVWDLELASIHGWGVRGCRRGGLVILPSTGGCYDSSLSARNLLSSFSLKDTLTDIGVSR